MGRFFKYYIKHYFHTNKMWRETFEVLSYTKIFRLDIFKSFIVFGVECQTFVIYGFKELQT